MPIRLDHPTAEERFALLDGEIVSIQARNPAHMRPKRWRMRELTAALAGERWVDGGPSFHGAGWENASAFAAPDIIVYPRKLAPEAVAGARADPVIEGADTTLDQDLGRKARLCARRGVREHWVCDVNAGVTHVHRGPGEARYPPPDEIAFDAPITPLAFPSLALRLAAAS